MASTQITFDRLAYVDKLKSGGIDEAAARAHAEALDQALRDTVATKQDLREVQHQIEVAVRDLKIWTGGSIILLFGALASIKFFG
jgi:hypothetical protein